MSNITTKNIVLQVLTEKLGVIHRLIRTCVMPSLPFGVADEKCFAENEARQDTKLQVRNCMKDELQGPDDRRCRKLFAICPLCLRIHQAVWVDDK